MSAGKRLSTRELAQLALFTALTVGGKEAMAAIPGFEPVTLLLLLCTLLYGAKAIYVALAFAACEIGLYGLGLWNLMYVYIWPLLVVAALPFRAMRSRLFWAAFAGIFGLCFGALCAVVYLPDGFGAALAWWVAGIPTDLAHGAGNAILAFFLLLPLYTRVEKLKNR